MPMLLLSSLFVPMYELFRYLISLLCAKPKAVLILKYTFVSFQIFFLNLSKTKLIYLVQ